MNLSFAPDLTTGPQRASHLSLGASMRRAVVGFSSAAVGFSSAMVCLGCESEPEDRSPPFQGSTGAPGPSGGGLGTSAGNGEGGSGESSATEAVGKVESFIDASFALTQEYSESAEVSIMNRDDSGTREVLYDGTTFRTERTMNSQWMAVVPEFDTSHIPTITLWDGIESEPNLAIVPRPVLSEILGSLIDSSTVNDERAYLMVKVLDQEGRDGLAGVVPTVSGGSNVAFEDGGVWTDGDDATNQSGLFFVYDIFARALPGQDVQVILTGSADAEFDARLAEGALTIVTYRIP